MYVLNPDDFRGLDVRKVSTFAGFWAQFYEPERVKYRDRDEPIDYFAELNIGGELSRQNIINLLRWKDAHMLTHPKGNGQPNQRVLRVLAKRDAINDFRAKRISVEQFSTIVDDMFNVGIVYKLFIFHIARPLEWPIADRNVIRAFRSLYGELPPLQTIDDFRRSYVTRFNRLARLLCRQRRVNGGSRLERLTVYKELDSALMMFGKFLRRYAPTG